jgi:hypothetical protein
MAALTSKRRNSLPSKDFALKGRRYPLDTKNRADSALSRVSHNGTPAQKAEVRRKVHARYPGIAVSGLKKGKKHEQRKRISK